MAFHIVKITFYVIICLASVASNAVLITILLRFEHLRTTANLFVLNLALCDVATVLLGIPFTIGVEESHSYPFGEAGCKILMPAATAAFNSAAFTLLAIAIDRFYAIMFPMRARLQSCKKKSFVLCLLHGLSVSSVIPLSIYQRYVKEVDKYICIEVWPEGGSRIYTLALFCIQYAMPLTLIAVLYSVSWNEIRKKNQVIIEMQEVQQRGRCHFNRSQSWDAAMKRHESSSLSKGNVTSITKGIDSLPLPKEGQALVPAGGENVVLKSTSSYSFKANLLEAVEEGSNYEASDNTPDDEEMATREEALIIGPSEYAQPLSGRRDAQKRVDKQGRINWSGRILSRREKQTKGSPRRPRGEACEMTEVASMGAIKHSATLSKDDSVRRLLKRKRVKNPKVSRLCKPLSKRKSNRKRARECDAQEGEHRRPQQTSEAERVAPRRRANSSAESIEPKQQQITPSSPNKGLDRASRHETEARSKQTSDKPTAEASNRLDERARAMFASWLHRQRGPNTAAAIPQGTMEPSAERPMIHSASSPEISCAATQSQRRRTSVPAVWQKSANQQETRTSRFSQTGLSTKKRATETAVSPGNNENMSIASIKRMKQTRRTLRMFTCVVVVFAVCMLPNQITWIWMAFNGAHLSHVLYTVFYFLMYTNSVINPWIYGAVNPSFRRAYSKIFFGQTNQNLIRRNPVRSSSKVSFLWLGSRTSDTSAPARPWNSRKSLVENGT